MYIDIPNSPSLFLFVCLQRGGGSLVKEVKHEFLGPNALTQCLAEIRGTLLSS